MKQGIVLGLPHEEKKKQTDYILYFSGNTDSDGTFPEKEVRPYSGSEQPECGVRAGGGEVRPGAGRRTPAESGTYI